MLEIEVTLAVARVLQSLGVPYCVGGSFASTVHGEARATRDVDMLVALHPAHVPAFTASLSDNFYVPVEDVLDAVSRAPTLRDTPSLRASFSIVHQASFFKVDLFVSCGRAFEQSELARQISIEIAPGEQLAVASAEDIILAKLEWYRLGNEVSDRQWRDILAIIAVQSERLDLAYLRAWAIVLTVGDLLERAMGNEPPGSREIRQGILF